MENDFNIEEMLDMFTEGEVQMNLTNTDCIGHNGLCKVKHQKNSESQMTNTDICTTGNYKEPVYIEADSGSHDKSNHGIFCVNGSDYIDIDDLF